ncbi:MAG: hypothetical protein HC853_04175 [Anaerolineae bacterium]|nr:hypothetical protein [Anaerolineae bacterium]
MPKVFIDDSVASDFRVLIRKTWWHFLEFFRARTDCFGDIHITAVRALEDRARYDPARAAVMVRVPERGSVLQAALIHEWAHHIEFQCDEQAALRAAFLAAQGLPLNTAWYREDGTTAMPSYVWGRVPSEQYAETVVAAVLRDRNFWTPARISAEGVRVITAWANKAPLP